MSNAVSTKNTLTRPVGLAVLMLSACCCVDGSPSFLRIPQQAANATEIELFTDCGDGDYHDIRTVTFMKFSAVRIARRTHRLIGDNVQLHCKDPNTCSFSGYPAEAICYNSKVDQLSDPLWDCQTTFPDRRYTFGNIRVSCEVLSETRDYCVLRDSCILSYVPSRETSLLLGFALTTMSMSTFFCLLAVACSARRHRADSGPVVSISSQTSEDLRSYDPATDLPPSYSFVESNPHCFEKPNRNSVESTNVSKEGPLSESPPPSYETFCG